MSNKAIANEWLELAKRNLDAAIILFKEKHFNDVIGIEPILIEKNKDESGFLKEIFKTGLIIK